MTQADSFPGSQNLLFVESLYASYLKDPQSVAEDWRRYFEKFADEEVGAVAIGPSFQPRSIFNPPRSSNGSVDRNGSGDHHDLAIMQDRVDQLIRAFRVRGHAMAQTNPLGLERPYQPELDPEYYGFSDQDMDRLFSTETIHGAETRTLRSIFDRLRNTYCRQVGIQFMHIGDHAVKEWLQERMEGTENRLKLRLRDQFRILSQLTAAVVFEEFVQKKFVGAKSFSLEGAESLIPLLGMAIEKAGEQNIEQIVLAMAHRGRLNVLANVLGKSAQQIFREFEDVDPGNYRGRGDVKYHLGYSKDWKTQSGRTVHLSLCFNPSHLEFVNPVAMGRVRAKQDRGGDLDRTRHLCLMIHGDAAFCGEGIIQETLNLSQLESYRTGGTIHVVVNNQIGFTTGPEQNCSSVYTTDVAKMLQIPIFYVNGEDPEAVAQVVQLAMNFRMTFHRDVVINMYCYRRRGHNETDEPAFTQPQLYKTIEKRKSVREAYLEHLLKMDGVTAEQADHIIEELRETLEKELSVARGHNYVRASDRPLTIWKGYKGASDNDVEEVDDGVTVERASSLLMKQTELPQDFKPHPKLERWLEMRRQMARGERMLDWAAAEAVAFAAVATDGYRIRLTGQDSERATFSQRHGVLHDYETGRTYTPLQHLSDTQAPVEIANSPLSEAAVLGFEYGYSLDWPDGLVMWEAQFGDFCNAAQVIIDQFIVSAEEKWRRLSGLVMLLPHGFEGMGPEHSSARLERFLTLAAEDNIQVVYPSTPAQYFHVLRRQVVRRYRKPLIVMTPKSMLRNPTAVSSLADLAAGTFKRMIGDVKREKGSPVDRVLICSGKLYYELEHYRTENRRDDVALLRMEQLYPLPAEPLRELLAEFSPGTPVVYVQEEPENMGAWRYLRVALGESIDGKWPLTGVYRPASASPATGSASSHKLEQAELIAAAYNSPLAGGRFPEKRVAVGAGN